MVKGDACENGLGMHENFPLWDFSWSSLLPGSDFAIEEDAWPFALGVAQVSSFNVLPHAIFGVSQLIQEHGLRVVFQQRQRLCTGMPCRLVAGRGRSSGGLRLAFPVSRSIACLHPVPCRAYILLSYCHPRITLFVLGSGRCRGTLRLCPLGYVPFSTCM